MTHLLLADTALCRRLPGNYAGWVPYYLDIDGKDGYVLLLSLDNKVEKSCVVIFSNRRKA